jgi:hypothetical protein
VAMRYTTSVTTRTGTTRGPAWVSSSSRQPV